MKNTKEKKGSPLPVRFYPSTEELLRKVSLIEDRSLNYLIERSVRKDPELIKYLETS